MCKTLFQTYLAGLLAALVFCAEGFAQSAGGRPDGCNNPALKVQESDSSRRERMARAEQRVEALWPRLFEVQLQEIDLRARLDDLDYRSTPDGIRQALAFVGSVRPMDELREAMRIRLEGVRAGLNKQLELLAATRERLQAAISEADAEIERLRQE